MIADVNLIAYYTEEEILPYPRYKSGVKDEDKSIFKYDIEEDANPLLTLSEDIILPSGLGLKRGFYRVKLSEDFNYLLLYTSRKLSAKIPVINLTTLDAKPKKLKKDKQHVWHKKDHLGESSENYIHKKAEIMYDNKTNSYIIIWERGNTKAIGTFSAGDVK